MELSRRQFLTHGVAAALGATGIYSLIDDVAAAGAQIAPPPPPPRPAGPGAVGSGPRPPAPANEPGRPGGSSATDSITADSLTAEQYRYASRVLTANGVDVLVPPLHHAVVTATLNEAPSAANQSALEAVLAELEAEGLVDFTASGAGVSVAWGTSYFAKLPAALTSAYLPVDLAASARNGTTTGALTDAVAFASDPSSVRLEQNDCCVVVASDSLANLNAAITAIFQGDVSGLFTVTSIRRGFVDASRVASGGQSLTKQMAVSAGIPGASMIPDDAELFLGFTSTQANSLAPLDVANLETLPGFTDQFPNGYFVHGTTMHLSHLSEDLPGWYAQSYKARVGAAFSSTRRQHTNGALTIPNDRIESEPQLRADLAATGYVGHATSMQPRSRLGRPVRDNYGRPWGPDTPLVLRADFNTVDSPFAYSSDESGDGFSSSPSAGVHFVAYAPTCSVFESVRRAMDGQYPDGSLGAAAVAGPFNRLISATHRQNFLVPPRAHRSFPLAELL